MRAIIVIVAQAIVALSVLVLELQAASKDCIDIGVGIIPGGGGETSTGLQFDSYLGTCPQVEDIVYSEVQQAVSADPRMAASLLRLHFHDCFVNGCDGSVLLDDSTDFASEKSAGPNLNSLRGFEVIDSIKLELELACPGVVSCADILAIAARDSVMLSGGPTWQVELGRRDSLTASRTVANANLPAPTSNVPTLIQKFRNVGLSTNDMVALSGAHTIGKARCLSFSSRLTGSSNDARAGFTDGVFIAALQELCANSNGTLAQLDLATPATFDNQYYVNLISGDGLLQSDQVLVAGSNGEIAGLVQAYAMDMMMFFEDFKNSMVRMGRLAPLAGFASGEVRRNCRVVN